MNALDSFNKTACELAKSIKIFSDRIKTLSEKGQDTSATDNELNSACNELERVNTVIKNLTP